MLTRMRRKKNQQSERRPAIDKQTAYREFKVTETATSIEQEIVNCRGSLKAKRVELSHKTEEVNAIKGEIDHVKSFLDMKAEEKTRNAMA